MSEFVKHNQGKPRMSLLPIGVLEDIIDVLEHGAAKYEEADNWKNADRYSIYYDACQRHLSAWWKGKDYDEETKKSHLAHAVCCLVFLMAFQKYGFSRDDRLDLFEKHDLKELFMQNKNKPKIRIDGYQPEFSSIDHNNPPKGGSGVCKEPQTINLNINKEMNS